MQQFVGAADVTQVTGIEQRFDQLGHCPVAPLEEQSHVGAAPDQGAGGASAEDGLTLVAIGQEFADVARQKGAIGFGEHEEIPGGFGQAAARGPAVALTRLDDLPRGSPGHFLAGAWFGVVVDDQHFVDEARGEEAFDGGADRAPLGIRHQDHRDPLPLPHAFPQDTEHANMRLDRATYCAMGDWSLTGSQNPHQREASLGRVGQSFGQDNGANMLQGYGMTSAMSQSAACETAGASTLVGRVTTKRVPPSAGKSARISPPCRVTTCQLTYSPSPKPCVASSGRAWKKRSKILSRAS